MNTGTTGLRPDTFNNLQLNAGLFLEGFSWDASKTVQELKEALAAFIEAGRGVLGATRGGGSFRANMNLRSVEADGKRMEFVGSRLNDGWTVKLSTTLIETTPENFARCLACAELEKPGDRPGITVLRARNTILNTDYRPRLCWVGDTSRGYVLIELNHVLNTEGANFTFTDRGEGTLPVTFEAHQQDISDQDYAPFRIVFFDAMQDR